MSALLDDLVDDAAILGSLEPAAATGAYTTRDDSRVRTLVCPNRVLHDVLPLLQSPTPLAIWVTGGAGAIGPAITMATRDERVRLRTVQVALRDEDDLARNAERVVRALDQDLPDDATAAVVMPPIAYGAATWDAAADEIAAAEHTLAYRVSDDLPGDAELAAFVDKALDRECGFALTGSIGAVRTDRRHGILNVLLGTNALWDGDSADRAAELLAERDPTGIREALASWDDARAARVRRWFTSCASTDVDALLPRL